MSLWIVPALYDGLAHTGVSQHASHSSIGDQPWWLLALHWMLDRPMSRMTDKQQTLGTQNAYPQAIIYRCTKENQLAYL